MRSVEQCRECGKHGFSNPAGIPLVVGADGKGLKRLSERRGPKITINAMGEWLSPEKGMKVTIVPKSGRKQPISGCGFLLTSL